MTASTRSTPLTLRLAIVLLFVQAAAVGAAALFFAYEGATQKAVSAGTAVSVVLWPAGIAVLLALLAWLLVRRRALARSPAIVLELLLVPIGWYMTAGGAPWMGVPAIVLGLAGAGTLLAPSCRSALGIH